VISTKAKNESITSYALRCYEKAIRDTKESIKKEFIKCYGKDERWEYTCEIVDRTEVKSE